ncbi:hypothetical protein ACFY3B_11540 [Micromonospora parva]|uniref:Uncharacterized protein n=1 Tax=Micromonospora parva TaxID=1464048 RepID=A0ABW6VS84_9ACTN
MTGWDRSDQLTALGIVVAVIAIVVGALAARRWGARRRLLRFDCIITPLILVPSKHLEAWSKDLIKVTYRDLEVKEPHLAQIRLRNVGPSDVSSAHFDEGKPLSINLNCIMYGIISSSIPTATTTPAIGGEAIIELGPHLLRRGEEWLVSALVSGYPVLEIESSLIDTDLRNDYARRVDEANEVPIP